MPKIDLVLEPPLLNAAGSLGFAPDLHGVVDIHQLGAFITNPISTAPRQPARGNRWTPFSGGVLLHTGHPNPGLQETIKRYAEQWRRSPIPVLTHLLAENPEQVERALRVLEEIEGVGGVELGLPANIEPEDAGELIKTALGELPIIARVHYNGRKELIAEIDRMGIAAICISPPRGALPGSDGAITSGRLYGPCALPIILGHLRSLDWVQTDLIACGGIFKPEDVEVMLNAGAKAVQLDSVLWRGKWPL